MRNASLAPPTQHALAVELLQVRKLAKHAAPVVCIRCCGVAIQAQRNEERQPGKSPQRRSQVVDVVRTQIELAYRRRELVARDSLTAKGTASKVTKAQHRCHHVKPPQGSTHIKLWDRDSLATWRNCVNEPPGDSPRMRL